ncbi:MULTISPECIES: EpsG family protein [unclassified Chryseobacterium]|uniref:EpsG family protein n=1 Tax=unclassified Chryseobacterium TaxID=2593645 RepID=UPI000F4524E0|nr:EpsG family protein [Chryseobacterium sp. G0240]ROI02645.1 EpsG family protein [Chryseobacterium sp. G0240]
MEVYIMIILIVLFFLALKVKNTIIVVLFLIIVATLRNYTVGVDTNNYLINYKYEIELYRIPQLIKKIEIGWLYLNAFVKEYFQEFRMILFVSSILTLLPLSYVFRRETKSPLLTFLFYILLFYYFFSFSIMRQAIAVSFFVLAVHFLVKGKQLKFFLYVGIGALFHYSILALIPITFILKKINLSYFWYSTILIITFFIGFSGVLDLAKSYLALLPFEKYANYEGYNADVTFNRIANYIFIVPKILLFIYIFYYTKKYNLYNNVIQMKLFWVGIIVLNLFLSVPQVSRFTYYLTIFEVIIMSALVFNIPKKKKLEVLIVCVSYCLVYFVYYSITNRFGVIPYKI